MADLSGWRDEWDLVLRNGNVAEQTRVTYVRSERQFTDHLSDDRPDLTRSGQAA